MIHSELFGRQSLLPPALKAVIMDVDGTLYKQAPVRRAMLCRILKAHVGHARAGLVALRYLAAYRKAQEALRGSPVTEVPIQQRQLALACQCTGASQEVLSACVAKWMEQEPLDVLRAARYPHLIEFLRSARARNIHLAVLSDYDPARKLEALGISGFFDVVASAQDCDIRALKPNPSGLHAVLRRLGVHPAEAVYIGDRVELDAAAARAAGVAGIIIGRSTSRAPSEFIAVPDYRQLTDALCQGREECSPPMLHCGGSSSTDGNELESPH